MARSRRRQLVFLVVTTALGAGGALAVLEGGLRLLRPSQTGVRALLYQATLPTDYGSVHTLRELLDTTVIGYRPHTESAGYVLNARSFRTREYAEQKPVGALRVAALGDSFTYGGVPDRAHWCSLLEQGLVARSAAPVEVLRLGMPGTGPPFYLRLWEIEAARLRPDLVIVAFFVGNDFFDEQGRSGGWRGAVEQAAGVSYSVRLARNLLRLGRGLPRRDATGAEGQVYERGGFELPGAEARDDESQPTLAQAAFVEIERDRLTLCLDSARLTFAVRLDRVLRILRELQAQVTRSGSRLTLLVIPDQFQVEPDVARAAAAKQGLALERYDLERPQRELTQALAGEGIDHLDLLPVFREHARRESLYRLQDTHWSRAGHRLAAEQLLAHLARPALR